MRIFLAFVISILCTASAWASGGMVGGGKSPPPDLHIEIPELELLMTAPLLEYNSLSFARLDSSELEGLKQAASQGLKASIHSEDQSSLSMELGLLPSGEVTLSDGNGLSIILVD